MKNEAVLITGVWLRRIGKDAQVLVEVDGICRLVIVERADANYSHFVHPEGIRRALTDPITETAPTGAGRED